MEYNKNGLNPKRTPRKPDGTRPDLIVHTRNSNEFNAPGKNGIPGPAYCWNRT